MKYKPTLFDNLGLTNDFEEFICPVSIFLERYNEDDLIVNPVNILIEGLEPPEKNYKWLDPLDIIKNHQKFDLILARNPIIINNCPNAHVFPFGGRMVESLKVEPKRDKVSFLCGWKQELPGHSLRHSILNKNQFKSNMELDFNYRIDKKHDIFKDSKYSIVIENTQHENYFTEKIVDCLMLKTIPIYWGCPNISHYFNMNSLITFNNKKELTDILERLDGDFYNNNIKHVNDNFIRSINYSDFYARVSNIVKHYLL